MMIFGIVLFFFAVLGAPLFAVIATSAMAGFWRSGYQDVKREMKGRYPKHPWPDDPLLAVATGQTKKRAGIH